MVTNSVWRLLKVGPAFWFADECRVLGCRLGYAKRRSLIYATVALATGVLQLHGGAIRATVEFPVAASVVVTTTAPNTQLNLTSLVVADFNNDGRPDLAASSRASNRIAWYQNLGGGVFSVPGTVISTSLVDPASLFAADLDNDQLIDLACSSGFTGNHRVSWFRNIGGSPSELNSVFTDPDTTVGGSGICVANVDGQGLPDLIATSFAIFAPDTKSTIAWHRNNGNGTFTRTVISTALKSPTSPKPADLDGDGVTDFVVSGSRFGTIEWFKGSLPGGNPLFTRFPNRMDTSRDVATGSAIGDIDGDGRQDVLCSATIAASSHLTWYKNETQVPGATDDFFGGRQIISGASAGAFSVAVADLNSDGKPDAVAATYGSGGAAVDKIAWFENLGASSFFNWNAGSPAANSRVISTALTGALIVATADFNQDGVIDVVSGSDTDGKIVVYINQGGQSALATTNTAPGALTEWRMDHMLRIVASNSGYGADNSAKLSSVALDLETSAGVSMTTAQANLLIDRIDVYSDTNGSNAFEVSADTLVGRADNLVLSGGLLTVPIVPTNPSDSQIAARATQNDPRLSRTFFVVARAGGAGSAQVPNTFRMTHRSKGTGRTALNDATTGAALTVELLGNNIVNSALVTVQPAPVPRTYTDYSYIYFADTAVPGAGPTQDFDLDGTLNLSEFAFGLDPTVGPATTMVVTNGVLTQRGLPTVFVANTGTGVDFQARFCRRKDPLSGLTYKVQFSADLVAWEESTPPPVPTVIADDGQIQAVSVPYPFFLSDFRKAQFFRVAVTSQ